MGMERTGAILGGGKVPRINGVEAGIVNRDVNPDRHAGEGGLFDAHFDLWAVIFGMRAVICRRLGGCCHH